MTIYKKIITPGLLFIIILLLGIALRVYDLGKESYWIDEMSTVVDGQQSLQQMFGSGRLDQPPAYYLPFHIWVNAFGTSEVSTRSFSVLTGIGSIVIIYLIGKELFGKPTGLISAFLMACTEFQLFYSQSARFYSFFEFMTLLSFLFFILALRNKKNIYFLLYCLTSIIMLYSHTYGVFILIAQNLTMFIQIKKYRKIIFTWLMSQLLIAIAYLPYLLPLLLGGGGGVIGAIDSNIGGLPTPTIIDPLRSIYQFVFSQRRDRSWDDIFINNVFGLIWLLAISWVHFLRQGKIKPLTFVKNSFIDLREEPDLLNKSLLLGCWFLCPILIPFIASYVVSPMYDTHYTISAAPALYLIIAYGLYSLRKIVPVIASIGALIILIGPGLGYYYETNTKEEWQHAATYVNENSKPGDMIVFAPNMGTGKGYQEIVFDYYYKGSLSGCGIHPNPPSPELITKELLRCIPNHDRFWVIVYEYYKDEHYLSYFRDPNTPAGHLINEQKYYGMTIFLFENR